MPIYAVKYGSPEDSDAIYFEHQEIYTEEEFEIITINAIVDYLKKIKEKKNRWPILNNIAGLFPDGIINAMESFGFKEIKSKAETVFSGWQDPFCERLRWFTNATDNLMKALEKEGFTKEDSKGYVYRQKRQQGAKRLFTERFLFGKE